MLLLVANLLSAFRNTVKLVYDRIQVMKKPAFILMWKLAIQGLFEYLTFKRL